MDTKKPMKTAPYKDKIGRKIIEKIVPINTADNAPDQVFFGLILGISFGPLK